MLVAQSRIRGACRVAACPSALAPARARAVSAKGGKTPASLGGALVLKGIRVKGEKIVPEGSTAPHTKLTVCMNFEADADPTGPLSVEEQALEQAAHACQALEDAVQEVVKAVVASTQLQQPGSSIAPKLPVPPHVVVVAPTRVYVACYQRYVEDARNVVRIAGRALTIWKKMSAGDPSVAAYQGKEVIPVFMVGECASPEVDALVQDTCNRLGVLRYRPTGDGLSVQP